MTERNEYNMTYRHNQIMACMNYLQDKKN
jgi:hypothetical protein